MEYYTSHDGDRASVSSKLGDIVDQFLNLVTNILAFSSHGVIPIGHMRSLPWMGWLCTR
jgi:hypothetical protein